MFVRRILPFLIFTLAIVTIPSHLDIVFALNGDRPPETIDVCHDGIWGPYEYCGRDCFVATTFTDMNHDCQVDFLDFALFAAQYGTSGPGLSGDFFGSTIFSPPNGQVAANDFSYLAGKLHQAVTPCTPVLVPSVCQGTIALSFAPGTIDDNDAQSPGARTAYVIIDGFADASTVEYAVITSPNVTITNHFSTELNALAGSYCQTSGLGGMILARIDPMASGPVTIAAIEYTLADTNPATLTLAPANCNYARVRWTTEEASVSYDFDTIRHAGINGPTPAPTSCPGPTALGTISGNVYADIAGPCVFNSGIDYAIAGIVVLITPVTPGPYTALTDAAGDYEIQVPPGSYTVSLAPGATNDPWKYFSLCQSPTYAVNVVANVTDSGNDFALKPVGTVAGRVFADYGNDCVFDSGTDVPIAGQMITANPGGYIAYTDENGNYALVIPVGNYNVSRLPVTNDPWELQSCQQSFYAVTVTDNNIEPGNDFAIIGTGPPHCDVSVNIVSHGIHVGPPCPSGHDWMLTPCPGIEHEYLFIVKSEPTSTTPVPSGTLVTIWLSTVFSLGTVTSDFPIVVDNVGPYACDVYLDADLNPGQTCVVRVRATPSGGGPYEAGAQIINPPCGGNHGASIIETDQCSCDPNDLAVAPAGCGPNGEIVGDEPMTYTIRFENIGAGAAHNILIFDALDSDLDLSSLKILDASHPVTGWQVAFGNTLALGFEGIDLPGTYDPDNSKGFVIFSIDPKPNLADGTTIENTAQITFDFNEPVVTNTTLNTIRAVPCPPTGITPTETPLVHALGQNHPNPFNPATTIEYELAHGEHVTISVYNINGELVQTLVNASLPAGPHYVEWNGRDQGGTPVASGVYLYRMHAGSFVDTKKLVLLK
ncbi:MAG: T9SS C-terminal target domain-containing protein [Acidobacteria bacterium]|nr:MAG: T9SS C-terminal target domain-containing protein [Acidobacteriota bacterium]